MEITFDPAKNQRNLEERGLAFELARDLDWSSAVIEEDTRQNYGERRFRAFGYVGDRLFAVVFTPRAGKLHIISLRKANRREVQHYGQETP